MLPAVLIINDDLPFRLDNVRSGRTDTPAPASTVSYELLDAESRAQITSGNMTQYDSTAASYEAVIGAAELVEPTIVPGRDYMLRAIITNAGVKTTKSSKLRAMYDEPSEG